MLEAYILLANIEFLTLSDYDMCPTMADPRGATGANAPLQKIEKNEFLVILKVFGPLQCFRVCHTTENTLFTCTR